MGTVFTKCPVTGAPIATGVDMDEETFASLMPFVGRVMCPHCKGVHEWTRGQAWIVADQDGSK
jgi:hypothetical protein